MKPVTFSCEATLRLTPQEIAEKILDVDNWSAFTGYGLIPGIKTAEFELRRPEVVGSRVRVVNSDGSSHVEEIIEWEPERRLRLHMQDFSPPLARLATGFDETWTFEQAGDKTKVVRAFALHPQSSLSRILLEGIAVFLKRAIARHLKDIR